MRFRWFSRRMPPNVEVAIILVLSIGLCSCSDDPRWKTVTRAKPRAQDLLGTWKATKKSARCLKEYLGYEPEKCIIEICSDGRFRATNFPMGMLNASLPRSTEVTLLNGDGRWQLDLNYSAWVISIITGAGYKDSISLRGESPPYFLSYHVGGPDSSDIIYYEREVMVSADSAEGRKTTE